MTVRTLSTTTFNARIFWTLTYALIILVALYLYFINTIVMGVVGREQLRNQFSVLKSAVTGLEASEVTLSGGITLERAHSLGFKDAGESASFAYSSKPGLTLSYRPH